MASLFHQKSHFKSLLSTLLFFAFCCVFFTPIYAEQPPTFATSHPDNEEFDITPTPPNSPLPTDYNTTPAPTPPHTDNSFSRLPIPTTLPDLSSSTSLGMPSPTVSPPSTTSPLPATDTTPTPSPSPTPTIVPPTTTCTPPTTTITIAHTISGNMSDSGHIFHYQAKLRNCINSDWITLPDTMATNYTIKDSIITFSLTHGNSIQITGIPVLSTLYIQPLDSASYTTTVKANTDASPIVPNSGYYVIPIAFSCHIQIDQCKQILPDTGIHVDTLPYLLFFLIFIVGSAVWLFINRSNFFNRR